MTAFFQVTLHDQGNLLLGELLLALGAWHQHTLVGGESLGAVVFAQRHGQAPIFGRLPEGTPVPIEQPCS